MAGDINSLNLLVHTLVVCWFFFKSTFSKTFRNTIWVSNKLDLDQARRFVGPGLGPICLQRLWADDTSRQWGILWHVVYHSSISRNFSHLLTWWEASVRQESELLLKIGHGSHLEILQSSTPYPYVWLNYHGSHLGSLLATSPPDCA